MKTILYIMRLVSCICVLTFCASCVLDVTTEPSAESLRKTSAVPKGTPCGGCLTADALTVFFTGNELGELKPCGCSGGQLGGLERRAAVFNRVPRGKSLIVDTGSLVKSDSGQDLIKFSIILQAFKLLDYDLVSLGEKDIEIGRNAGLLDDIGPAFNIISPQRSSDMKSAAKFTKSLLLKGKTVVVTIAAFDVKSSPFEQIGQLFTAGSAVIPVPVRGESNLVPFGINILILNTCDVPIIDFIAERFPLVDCIVCPSESDEPMVAGDPNKRPLVFSVGRFGRYVCELQITEATGVKVQPKLSFFAIPVEEDLEQEASLVQLYKDYQQLVRERGLLEKYPRFTLPGGLEYTGSASCRVCHEYEYGRWSQNAHARAYATLEGVGSHFDPECVVCHVVGMEYEKGFISEQKTGHLKNVGCENCHGPGSEHIMTAGKAKLTEPKSACIDCHTPEHSGDYAGNEHSFLKKIVHWKEPKPPALVK